MFHDFKQRIALTCALLCAAAPGAMGQTDDGVDFFQSSLGEILDTPMLAASYSEERPSDAAATAYVITAETINKRGYSTLADLLNDIPQFQVQRNSDVRRLNLISVRGVPYNERLVILYDGVRVTPPTGDVVNMGGQFSLKSAERVEIVLGPMSSLYGADAFSGVVNIVTRRHVPAAAGAKYGSFNSRAGSLSATAGLPPERPGDNSAGASASVAYEIQASDNPKLPDFYKNDYSWFNNEYQAGKVKLPNPASPPITVPVVRYNADTESSFLNASLNLGDFETGIIKMRESHSSSIGVKPELTIYGKDSRFTTDNWTLYGRHSYTASDESWKLSTLVSHYNYEIDPETRFVNSFSGYDDAYKYASAQTNYLEEALSFEPSAGFPVLLGITYQENSILPYTSDLGHKFNTNQSPNTQGFMYSGSTIPVDFYSLRYGNTGAFMQVQARELGNATVSLGLRYDYNTAYGPTWNPRAGIVWKPGGEEHTVVKLLYGEAYLAPSPFYTHKTFGFFYSTTSGLTSDFFHVPSTDLDPEKIRSVEGDIAHSFGHGLRLSLNPYYTNVRNLIQDVLTGPGTFHEVAVKQIEKAMNQGDMKTYGATLRADAVLRSGKWSYEPWAAYTYSEGRLAGGPLPFNSKHTIQSGVSALRGRWIITPKVLYRSDSRNQDGTRVPQFTVVDFSVRYSFYRIKKGALTAYLNLKNLLDRRYYNGAYGGGQDHLAGAPQDPFSAEAGFSLRF